jgi:hypothetical protein
VQSSAGAVTLTSGGAIDLNVIGAATNAAVTAAGTLQLRNATVGGTTTLTGGSTVNLGSVTSGGAATVTAGTTLTAATVATTGAGAGVALTAPGGIAVANLDSAGTTILSANGGLIDVDALRSVGTVDARARGVTIDSSQGNLDFTNVIATAGDVSLAVLGGSLTIRNATATGGLTAVSIDTLTAGTVTASDINLGSADTMVINGAVTATGNLLFSSRRSLFVNAAAVGRTMSVASGDIVISTAGRLGAVGTTTGLFIRNSDDQVQTFVGGADTTRGYSLSTAEMNRIFGNDVTITAPIVNLRGGGQLGNNSPPDLIIDSFGFISGAAAGGNLGTAGTLTLSTAGSARVVGAVDVTGLSAANHVRISATRALEVILGQGSIALSNGGALAGTLDLVSSDIAVATFAAIDAIAPLTDTAAIEDRLALNDGVTSAVGALSANGITFTVSNGVYIQNSGANAGRPNNYNDRRGFTAGAGGVTINPGSVTTRIIINGRVTDPLGVIAVGVPALSLVTINGPQATATGPGGPAVFDPLSTINGCVILNVAACRVDLNSTPPVQDTIIDQVTGDNRGDDFTLSLIVDLREVAPLLTDPLIDDPVTGTGNDDLWVAPDDCQPGEGASACPAPSP